MSPTPPFRLSLPARQGWTERAGAAGPRRALGPLQGLMLRATTGRFRPERRLPDRCLAPFTELEAAGWRFREACPRHYIAWRNGALVQESAAPVAIFPDGAVRLAVAERAMVSLFELLRRAARVELVEAGRPAAFADAPEMTVSLIGQAADAALGDGFGGMETGLWLLRRAELKILEAATGWPVGNAADGAAFLPPHLRRL